MIIVLPWPYKSLHPNSRKDRRSSTGDRQNYHLYAFLEARVQSKGAFKPDGFVPLNIMFYPPDKRLRDLDGMLSAIKSGLDGVAMALEINDNKFRPITIDIGEPVKGGKVVICVD